MWEILDADGSFYIILHAVGLPAALALLVRNVDIAVAATALSLPAAEVLLYLFELLDVHGHCVIGDADGIDRVLNVGVVPAADGVLV